MSIRTFNDQWGFGDKPLTWTDEIGRVFNYTPGKDLKRPALGSILTSTDPIVKTEPDTNMEAAHSFRYRLREAAKQALTLGDTLLQMSQDASEPTDKQLEELGSIEQSLRVVIKYRVPDMKPCATG